MILFQQKEKRFGVKHYKINRSYNVQWIQYNKFCCKTFTYTNTSKEIEKPITNKEAVQMGFSSDFYDAELFKP